MAEYVTVQPQTARCDQYMNGKLLVSCEARYPEFHSDEFRQQLIHINQHYLRRGHQVCAECSGVLRQSALEDYRAREASGDPFNAYEALLTYALTLNRDCTLSLYLDDYTYTGGAHGNTTREGDTWNLQTGARMRLSEMFPGNPDYRQQIILYIQNQIAEQMEDGDAGYYDDSAALVPGAFDPEQFYLTPRGLVIFFQQYDIAPYSSGIPEFLIPWGTDGASIPECATK